MCPSDNASGGFRLFSSSKPAARPHPPPPSTTSAPKAIRRSTPSSSLTTANTFSSLGLSPWAAAVCKELGMTLPTPVQRHCIPAIISGRDVMGIAQTGSGKTAAFALPMLHALEKDPFGVFALVVTPTRELACQIADQFRALGSSLPVRCAVVVGGMDMTTQAKELIQRPHVVIATPGRIRRLLQEEPDLPAVFARTKVKYYRDALGSFGRITAVNGRGNTLPDQFLVLDEADKVLNVGFEEELRVIFQCLPKERQTLLFSATKTKELEALLEISSNSSYFYEAYEGVQTVDSLKQQYVFIPKNVKEVYLVHILSKMEDMCIRSVIVFVATCRSCHLLSLLLEELEINAVALHSHKAQSSRLAALNRFKSKQTPILLATDVASRGLDVPTVDLVINYDIPRDPFDYVHRVGRTARAGREGFSISIITQNDVDLIGEIEAKVGKKMALFDCNEKEILDDITKVYKAKRVARMKMVDDGFEESAKARKEQKLKMLSEKGLLKKRKKYRV